MRVFADRIEAGRALAAALAGRVKTADVCVLALPRGGVPVAAEVARALDAPLDVLVVRKIGAPGQPELALGAIASGGVVVMNESILRLFAGSRGIEQTVERERRELARRERAYRGDRPPLEVAGRCVIIVDDGMATGATMRAAVRAVRSRGADRIVVAVPTAPPDACDAMEREADAMVSVDRPEPFDAVGRWYADFTQTTDEEVRRLLEEGRERVEQRARD
jgi:putative phosphoribosyl transferase